MRVLSINVYNYHRGGAETVYFNTSEMLEKHGHDVARFTLKWAENVPSPYSDYFPESKETRNGLLRPIRNILTYFYHREAARKLNQLINDFKPDIAQVHLIWGQLTPSILKVLKKHKVPVILTIHDYRIVCPAYLFRNGNGDVCEECQGKKFYKCISKTCCKGSKGLSAMMALEQYFRNTFFNPAKLSSGLLYVSDFSKQIHEKYMPALKQLPSAQIYNMSSEIESQPIKSDEDIYYLYFGRLSREKGIETVIDAFAQLPDAKLKIVGTGPLSDELTKSVKERQLSNIEFLGYKKGDELKKIVSKARFAIVPSTWYENNPMTIIEAYSVGTPVIGAKIGGIPEIIDNGKTGFQFKSRDVEDLRNVIIKSMHLTAGQYEDMQNKALEFAQNNFSPELYYNRLIEFYNQVIDIYSSRV